MRDQQVYADRRLWLDELWSGSLEGKKIHIPLESTMILAPGSYIPKEYGMSLKYTDPGGEVWDCVPNAGPFTLINPIAFYNPNGTPFELTYYPVQSARGVQLFKNIAPDGGGFFTVVQPFPGYWSLVAVSAGAERLKVLDGSTPIGMVLKTTLPALTTALVLRVQALL
ncbi:MAG: hypothetical protein HQL86_07000 [Magnetococcales bacterium]|nr:hypothetical protein [Magnetococcales bacterium]